MQILPLTEAHADAATGLWQACSLTRPWNDPAADFYRALASPASTVLGAVAADAGVLGTVMVGHDGHRAWMYYLAVDPARRRQGLGRQLVDAAERWAENQGAPKMMLMVRASNTDVVAFYESLDYRDQDAVVLGRFFDAELNAQRAAAH